jgi:hypothetical protein
MYWFQSLFILSLIGIFFLPPPYANNHWLLICFIILLSSFHFSALFILPGDISYNLSKSYPANAGIFGVFNISHCAGQLLIAAFYTTIGKEYSYIFWVVSLLSGLGALYFVQYLEAGLSSRASNSDIHQHRNENRKFDNDFVDPNSPQSYY